MATRLTVKIPEELGRRAKAQAELEGTTLSEVVQRYLEEYVGLDLLEEAADLRFVREMEARLERGEERFDDWEQLKSELDALAK